MDLEEKFRNHKKVKQARSLLKEADIEIKEQYKVMILNMICCCKHKRKDHTESHNINYTGGCCYKCKCLNFLQSNV